MHASSCPPYERTPARGPVSQNSTAYASVEVDVILGELNSLTEKVTPSQTEVWHGETISIEGFSAYRHEIPDSLERR